MTLQKPDRNKPVFRLFPKMWRLIEAGKCPTCKKDIKEEEFTDEKSIKEFGISGLCFSCQKAVFGGN